MLIYLITCIFLIPILALWKNIFCYRNNWLTILFPILSDQWHSDREPLIDRRQEADRKVKGQAKNGGPEGREGNTAEHP